MGHRLYYLKDESLDDCEDPELFFKTTKEFIENFKELLKDNNESIKFKLFAIFLLPWFVYHIRNDEICRYK